MFQLRLQSELPNDVDMIIAHADPVLTLGLDIVQEALLHLRSRSSFVQPKCSCIPTSFEPTSGGGDGGAMNNIFCQLLLITIFHLDFFFGNAGIGRKINAFQKNLRDHLAFGRRIWGLIGGSGDKLLG